MKKLLLLAASLVVGFSTTISALTAPSIGHLVTNAEVENGTAFTNGTIIALQCLDTAGGDGWFFNGAQPKSSTFSYSNFYRVVTVGDRFKLQSVAHENEYVGRTSDQTNKVIQMVASDHNMVETFVAEIATIDGWGSKAAEVTNGQSTLRLKSSKNYYLNTNDPGLTPKLHNGPGGYSVWYAYTFTEEEVASIVTTNVTLHFTGLNNEDLTIVAAVRLDSDINDALNNNHPEFFVPSAVTETNTTVSESNNTFHVTGTWDFPFTLNKVFRADLRKSASQSCTKWTVRANDTISTRNNANVDHFQPENLFYLRGHGYDANNRLQVTLHTIAREDSKGFYTTTENNYHGKFSDTPTTWVVKINSTATATDKGISLQHSDNTNAHVNDISGDLGLWTAAASQNDGGSFIRFFDLTDEDFENTSWSLDGETIAFDAPQLALAKANPTSENIRELFYPDNMPTEWFHMLNKETGGDREWSYLGYYPENGEVDWYIFNKDNGNRDAKIKSDFVTCGNFAGERTEADTHQINGQLWAWVEGTGANAGKYCLVNKAHPKGALSNKVINNDGNAIAAGENDANPSRWVYVESRKANPSEVCWFDISDSTTVANATYIRPTFVNPISAGAIYMALAAGGQKRQLIRISEDNQASAWWLMTPQNFDAFGAFNSELTAKGAFGFESMKAIIGGESINAAAPNHITPENLQTLVTEVVRPYAARFNKKVVRLQNYRRSNQNNAKTWLGLADNDGTAAIEGIADATNGTDLWLMLVNDNSQVSLRSLATGHNVSQATNSTVSSGTIENTVMFKVGTNYMNLHQTNAAVTEWHDANDPGSMWYVTLANDAFATPEVGEQYYRIVSDSWLSETQSPNLAINGENRDASGEGEVITRAAYAHTGAYWKLQTGSANGSVKLVNLVDEYAMGGTSDAIQQEEGNDYYLQALDGLGYVIKSANTTEGNICLKASGTGETLHLTNNGSAMPAANSNFSDTGSIFYFLAASEEEINNATERYVNAVKARIDFNANVTDDSENIIALIGEEKANEYLNAIEMLGKSDEYTTIAEVNDIKRNMKLDFSAIVSNIVAKHLGEQHIQFSSTKEGWDVHYLGVNNQQNLKGTTNKLDESTLWTIVPTEGGYKLYNEQAQKYVSGKIGMGSNGANGHYTLVGVDEAAVFTIGYNTNLASFYLCENPFGPTADKAVIHMSDNNGTIKNWNTGAGSNSHWYMHALEDATCQNARFNESQSHVVFALNGELTEIARNNNMVITVTAVQPQAQSARRVAAATHTVTTEDIQSDNTFSLPLEDGQWKVSIPGGMLRSANGLTRAAESIYTVDSEAGDVTGIEELTAKQPAAVNVVYDLQGRRLAAPVKGINIVNGKKVLVK